MTVRRVLATTAPGGSSLLSDERIEPVGRLIQDQEFGIVLDRCD